jgi:hypothetical protein
MILLIYRPQLVAPIGVLPEETLHGEVQQVAKTHSQEPIGEQLAEVQIVQQLEEIQLGVVQQAVTPIVQLLVVTPLGEAQAVEVQLGVAHLVDAQLGVVQLVETQLGVEQPEERIHSQELIGDPTGALPEETQLGVDQLVAETACLNKSFYFLQIVI